MWALTAVLIVLATAFCRLLKNPMIIWFVQESWRKVVENNREQRQDPGLEGWLVLHNQAVSMIHFIHCPPCEQRQLYKCLAEITQPPALFHYLDANRTGLSVHWKLHHMCRAETIQTPQRYKTLHINKFIIIMQIFDFDVLIFLLY